MAEIFCKRCLHHEELGRAVRPDEACPACGAGVWRRKGKAPRPSSHFPSVLRAIFSMRGIFFLIAFSFMGMFPIGVAATAAIIMLFLGSLKLAVKAMHVSDGKIDFPEVSAEELFDKSALIPAFAFVLLFVWAPPILGVYAASGVLTWDPTEHVTSSSSSSLSSSGMLDSMLAPPGAPAGAKRRATKAAPVHAPPSASGGSDDGSDLVGGGDKLDPSIADALKQAGLPADGHFDTGDLKKVLASEAPDVPAPHVREHANLDATRILSGLFGLFLFLWAPMALVLYLRTSSTLAMVFVPAGLRTLRNDPTGYLALCFFVLPVLALRFGADVLTGALPFFVAPPILFVKGVAVLFSWALCGLYVRQHARAFDLPVDDGDWVSNAPVVKGSLIT